MDDGDVSRRERLDLEWRVAKLRALVLAIAAMSQRTGKDAGEDPRKERFLDLFGLLGYLLEDAANELRRRFPADVEILGGEIGLTGRAAQGRFRDESLRLASDVERAILALQGHETGETSGAEPVENIQGETMAKGISMRAGNKGLTAKVNLWSLETVLDEHDAESARLWIKGQLTHADTGEVVKFNDAGELITILGKWNAQKFREIRDKK
jgi:hypothetical protein